MVPVVRSFLFQPQTNFLSIIRSNGATSMQCRLISLGLALWIMTLCFAPCGFAASRGLKIKTANGPLDFYNDYHAIVIGVSDYDYWPKIPNAIEDAREVSLKLLSMGYNVKLITNPDSAELNLILTRIAWDKGKEQNRALMIYFAGHGDTVGLADGSRLGYIIPKDCPLYNADPYTFDTKAISMKTLEMLALKIKSRHVLMMFDACFSGSIFGLTRAAPSEISNKSVLPVRQFITSGDANEQVPDQSVFKICFLQALDGFADYNKDGYLTGSELGMYLQTNVIQYTRGQQHPQYGKINNPLLDKGDFVFEIDGRTAEEEKDAAGQDQPVKSTGEALTKDNQENASQDQSYASIQNVAKKPSFHLRLEPTKMSDKEIRKIVVKYNFFDKHLNPKGKFKNKLNDLGNGTVIDGSTGLMWQKGRSPYQNRFSYTRSYINELNATRYGGHSDWRLPTFEELASLLESQQSAESYIDPLFSDSKTSFWTADTADRRAAYESYRAGWVISFSTGQIKFAQHNRSGAGAFAISANNFVRAVRTVK